VRGLVANSPTQRETPRKILAFSFLYLQTQIKEK
jgi:hypothetical protein